MNILPLQEKKYLHKEYRMRVVVVYLAFLFVLLVLAIILLIPPYVFLLYKNNVDQGLAQALPAHSSAQDTTAYTQESATAKNLIALLNMTSTSSPLLPTDIMNMIQKDKGPLVSISGINYSIKNQSPFTVTVQGTAKSREALLSCVEALQSEPGIAHIDVPVSSFVKDTDIAFSFTMQPQQKKK